VVVSRELMDEATSTRELPRWAGWSRHPHTQAADPTSTTTAACASGHGTGCCQGAQLEYGPEAPRQRRGQDHPRPLKIDCYSWQPPQPHHSPRSKLLTGHWAGEKLCLEVSLPATRAARVHCFTTDC